MRQVLGILILFLFVASCTRDEIPSSVSESPELMVSFDLDNEANEMIAGEAGYYLFTSTGSDSDSSVSIGYFSGKMAHFENESENASIEFRFRNHSDGAIQSGDIDIVLSDTHQYYNPDTRLFWKTTLEVDPVNSYGDEFVSVEWNFGDGTSEISQGMSIEHDYPYDSPQTTYFVCAKVNYSDCSDNICTDIHITPGPYMEASIQVIQNDPKIGRILSPIIVGGIPPYSYQWNFDNGIEVNTRQVKFVIGSSDNYIERAQLTVRDETGRTTTVGRHDRVGNTNECYANILGSTLANPVPLEDQEGFNMVEILYTDANGKTFSSRMPQDAMQYFRILEHGPYQLNRNSQQTSYMDIEFSCTLQSSDGETKNINNGTGRIAVAHP